MAVDAHETIKTRTLIIAFFAVFVVEAALAATTASFPDERLPLLGLARLFQTGALFGLVVILEGGAAAVGLRRGTLFQGVKKGVFWSAGFGSAALIAMGLLAMGGFDLGSLLRTRLPAGLDKLLLFLLVGGVLAPVTEEIFFRGILYGFFRRWGILTALVLSTAIFLLAHSLGSGLPLTQLVGGILFAAAYELEGNLIVPITIHCLGNLAIFAISLLL